MADDPDYRYSVNEYTGNGAQTNWEVSFSGGYISKDHVSVRVTNAATADITEPTFTWVNDYTIQIVPAVALGDTLKIYRNTPKDAPIVDYNDGSIINERNLDTGEKQAIFAIAEMADAFGTVPDREALNEAIAQAQAIIDQLNQQKDRAPLNVADYATADQWAAIKAGEVSVHAVLGAALIAASIQGRPLLLSGSQDFIWDGPEIVNPGVHLMGDGSKITKIGAGNMFATRWTRPALTAGLLTADVVKGSDTINVTALEAGNYAAGKWCLLTDLTLLRGTNNQFQGEFVRIRSITGSEVKLWGPTNYAFATTASARLVPVDNLLVPGVRYSDLHIVMDSTANPESDQTTFTLEGCINPVMQNVTVDRPIRPVVDLRNCINALIDAPRFNVGGSTISGGASASPGEYLPGFSYGVMERGLNLGLIMQGGHADNLRHMYTTVAIAQSDATPYGDPINSLIIGCIHNNAANAAFDTHEAGLNITFMGCKASNARYMGFQIRSKATRVIGCEVDGALGPGIWNRGANNPTNTAGVHANYCVYENNKLINTNQGTTFDGNDWTAWGAFMDEGSFTVCNRLHVEDAGGSAVMVYRNGGNLNGSFSNTFARNINTKSVANKHAFRIVGNLGAAGNYRVSGLEVIDPNGYTVDLLQVSSTNGSVIARGIEGSGNTGARIGTSAGAAINDDQYMTSLTVERSNDRGQCLNFQSTANGHLLSAYGNNPANPKSMFLDLHVTPDDLPPTTGIVEVGFRINGVKGLNWDSNGRAKVGETVIFDGTALTAADSDIVDTASVRAVNERSVITKRGPTFAYKSGLSNADNTARFNAFLAQVAAYGHGRVLKGVHNLNCGIVFDNDGTVIFDKGAVLDFTASTVVGIGITLGSDTLDSLPTIASDITKDSYTVVFSSAPALAVGDWFILQNPAEFSWMTALMSADNRNYYKKGEWCRVAAISGNTVTTVTAIRDSYLSTELVAFKPTMRRIIWEGGRYLGFMNTDTVYNSVIAGKNLYNSSIVAEVTNCQRSMVDLRRCVSSEATCVGQDYGPSVQLNYGVTLMACLDVTIQDSDITVRRHAVSNTSGGIAGIIPNRDCRVRNSTLRSLSSFAVDSHGHCDGWDIEDCVVHSSIILGGVRTRVKDTLIYTGNSGDMTGVAIAYRERKGWDTVIENVAVEVTTSAGGRYPLYLNVFQSDDTTQGACDWGGKLKISNVSVNGDKINNNLIRIGGGAVVGQFCDIEIDGVAYTATNTAADTSPVAYVDATGGNGYRNVMLRNLDQVRFGTHTSYKADRTVIRNLRVVGKGAGTGVNGILVSYASGAAGSLLIEGCDVSLVQGAGVEVTQAVNTDLVSTTIRNCVLGDNADDGSTVTASKAAIHLVNCNRYTIEGVRTLDTTGKQTRRFSTEGCLGGTTGSTIAGCIHQGTPRSDSFDVNPPQIRDRREYVEDRTEDANIGGISVGAYGSVVRATGTLTANRTATLSSTGAGIGSRIKFIHLSAGGFTWTVGGVALTINQYVEFMFNGTAWVVCDKGSVA